ncbi:hypothetical protein SAMN05421780_101506 [Flexibacter flexilis DSM 6793]|uniref:Uncharacterized protein n=1 Tax=Flexibacter flexilis DSM 6793 TaxID=927664 RepID=A0A1I1DWE3_9BACT|nr:hypothetical protein SAMN05421780_101506 [Flexibacter flexilis DSM 6793]
MLYSIQNTTQLPYDEQFTTFHCSCPSCSVITQKKSFALHIIYKLETECNF